MLVAVDTGGTKTLLTGFDHRGQPEDEHRFLTPKDPDEYLATLSALLFEEFISKKKTLDAIVIGIPGVIKKNTIAWCGNLPWQNFDLAGELQKLVSCPVWLANDADLAGLAETRALSHTPPLSLYVTISTGIGTGIIINGDLTPALSGSEGGHTLLEYDGTFRTWQSFASGSAIKRDYKSYARDITSKRTWNEIADKISRGFLALLPALQPDIVIIGGSIGTYFDRYSDQLEKILRTKLPDHIIMPKFRPALHPEEAVIYGCYYYGRDKLAR